MAGQWKIKKHVGPSQVYGGVDCRVTTYFLCDGDEKVGAVKDEATGERIIAALGAQERERALREALLGVATYNDAALGVCWCPDELWTGPGHAPECQDAQSALATPGEQP